MPSSSASAQRPGGNDSVGWKGCRPDHTDVTRALICDALFVALGAGVESGRAQTPKLAGHIQPRDSNQLSFTEHRAACFSPVGQSVYTCFVTTESTWRKRGRDSNTG
jgi:hypothetical protein